MKLDKILDFLFRTRIGHVALLGGLVAGAFMFSGCLCIDMIACACDPACDGCWSECDDMCNSCFIDCGGEDCALTGCLFGDGCVSDCGSCAIACGGCNSTICTDCNVGCDDGYGNCGLSCFNCVVSCDDDSPSVGGGSAESGCGGCSTPTHWKDITIYFYDQNGQQYIFENDLDDITKGEYKEYTYAEGNEPSQLSTYSSDYGLYYDFDGYYLDREFTDRATDSSGNWVNKKDVEDVTVLYGKLTERHYGENRLIRFSVEPDSLAVSYSDLFATVGGKISLPTPVSVSGYDLLYWETEAGKKFYPGSSSQDITFHLSDWVAESGMDSAVVNAKAVYGPAQIEMTFNFGADGILRREFDYETKLGDATQILKNSDSYYFNHYDKTFIGWSKNGDSAYNDCLSDEYLITQPETLYAVFSENVTVTLHFTKGPDNDDMIQEMSAEGLTFKLDGYRPDDVLPYVFDGWFFDPDFRYMAGTSFTVTKETKDLYAHWSKQTAYKIYYHLPNNGLTTSNYDMKENEPYNLMTPPPIPGYTFEGWCHQSDFSDEPFMELPPNTVGDQDLYAKYTPETFEILMMVESDAHLSSSSKTVTYGERYQLPVPTRNNYDFTGWKTVNGKMITDGEGNSLEAFTMDSIGVTLSEGQKLQVLPTWETHRFTVKFLGEDGNPIVTKQYEKGAQIGKPEGLTDPTKEGYDFKGWFDGSIMYNAEMQVQKDLTFAPKFDPHVYTVTLNANGGTIDGGSTKTIEITYGTKINLGAPQGLPEGKTFFLGWFTEPEGGEQLTYTDGQLLDPFDGKHVVLYAHYA